jgi:hypothetical protein
MTSLSEFIEDLTHERDKLIHMGIIKAPKAHAFFVHDGNNAQNYKSKRKGKEKAKKRHMQIQRRKGTPNPSMIPLVPKVEK